MESQTDRNRRIVGLVIRFRSCERDEIVLECRGLVWN